MIDILLCAPTYRSSTAAIRMIESLHHIDANVLCFITGSREDEELLVIADYLVGKDFPVILACAERNCAAFNQAWGFVWAVNNGLHAKYVCWIDDDVEFVHNDVAIMQAIEGAEPFSLLSLALPCEPREKNNPIGAGWLDACGIVAKFEDCVKYGVRDSQPEAPWIFYTEVEYMHRMCYFTNRPTASSVGCYYLHYQRTDADLIEKRAETEAEAFHYAGRFWKDKFDIDVHIDPIGDPDVWGELWALCNTGYNYNFEKHLIFDGRWVDWEDIYNSYNVEILRGVQQDE